MAGNEKRVKNEAGMAQQKILKAKEYGAYYGDDIKDIIAR